MNKTRLEAFSDGVIAIIITIMVLELKVPHDTTIRAILDLFPTFTSYLLSFVFVGIYWVNHHHLIHTVHQINWKIMWANFTLLFALSLIPFTTGWMGENHYAEIPVVLYTANLLFCAISYTFLQKTIMNGHVRTTKLIDALNKQAKKGYYSLALYLLAMIFAFIMPLISAFIFFIVAVMWIIPDKNIEKAFREDE